MMGKALSGELSYMQTGPVGLFIDVIILCSMCVFVTFIHLL